MVNRVAAMGEATGVLHDGLHSPSLTTISRTNSSTMKSLSTTERSDPSEFEQPKSLTPTSPNIETANSATDVGQDDSSSVRVAVRIRPQLSRDLVDACKVCLSKAKDEPQIWLGQNKAFTFDFVFGESVTQKEVYDHTVQGLVEGCFYGYNATVLAYGQTGSGKTYTMGTCFMGDGHSSNSYTAETSGIIPRAVQYLFSGISDRIEEASRENTSPLPQFKVYAQFLELYNEDIIDLLNPDSVQNGQTPNSRVSSAGSSAGGNFSFNSGRRNNCSSSGAVRIHEDSEGNINTVGVTTRTVCSYDETLLVLKQGVVNRTTASTAMNDESSRSHAIFTIYVQQQKRTSTASTGDLESSGDQMSKNEESFETLFSKFHFVDLAGSERLKRTGATGDRAKEGISINCGLLSLGNVISALGDVNRRPGCHVPYRDSKLTRLLQDSLGGNSRTLMIACVSPNDKDFLETLNTLKYANRARNIRNKVTANQDKTSRTISTLRQMIQELQLELMEYKQGKRLCNEDGEETVNDMYHENRMLSQENTSMRTRIKALQETIDTLKCRNVQFKTEFESNNFSARRQGRVDGSSEDKSDRNYSVSFIIGKYMTEIEELSTRLVESENIAEQLRKENSRIRRFSVNEIFNKPAASNFTASIGGSSQATSSTTSIIDHNGNNKNYTVPELIEIAKRELEIKRQKQLKKMEDRCRKRKLNNMDNNIAIESSSNLSREKSILSQTRDDKIENNSCSESEDDNSTSTSNMDGAVDSEENEDSEDEEGMHSDDGGVYGDTGPSPSEEELVDEEIVDLTSEISLKQKLIEELESSQRRLQAMRQSYEKKLSTLQSKITATEDERDRVLKKVSTSTASNVGRKSSTNNNNSEEIERVKKSYGDKLEKLQSDVKQLQLAKKEHAKVLKAQSQYEKQVEKLKKEVDEMKQSKVQLMVKLKEESNRHRTQEREKQNQISQMSKVSRKNESKIRSLEAESRLKESLLKRKNEEVNALKKSNSMQQKQQQQKQLKSDPTSQRQTTPQRMAPSRPRRYVKRFTPRSTPSEISLSKLNRKLRTRWQSIEKRINKVAMRRQTVNQIESDIQRWLDERQRMSHKLDELVNKRNLLMFSIRNEVNFLSTENGVGDVNSLKVELSEVEDEIENIRANITYLTDNISDCQQQVADFDQSVDESPSDSQGTNQNDCSTRAILRDCINFDALSHDELKFLFDKLLVMTLNQTCVAIQKDVSVKELEQRIATTTATAMMEGNPLFQHLFSAVTDKRQHSPVSSEETLQPTSDTRIHSFENVSNGGELRFQQPQVSFLVTPDRMKARQKMATKEELLFNSAPTSLNSSLFSSNRPLPNSFQNLRKPNFFTDKTAVRSLSFVKAQTPESFNSNYNTPMNGSEAPYLRSRSFIKPSSYGKGQLQQALVYRRQSKDSSTPRVSPAKSLISPYHIPMSHHAKTSSQLNPYSELMSLSFMSANKTPNTTVVGGNLRALNNNIGCPSPSTSRRQLAPRSSLRIPTSTRRTSMLNSQRESSASPCRSDQPAASPVPNRRSAGSRTPSSSHIQSNQDTSASSNGSPFHYHSTSNVFHRLIAGTKLSEPTHQPDQGKILAFRPGLETTRGISSSKYSASVLQCSEVATGHKTSVLSLYASPDASLLISASKDRTVKVWDVARKAEVSSLTGHPSAVTCVKYCPINRLVFSVSSSFIKVWDLRTPTTSRCLKVLSSSGLNTPGNVTPSTSESSDSGPINDIALAVNNCTTLFSAAGDKVRIWDLRKFHSIGKLSSCHQAAIMCLASGGVPDESSDYVVTGSKDHYVKLFKVNRDQSGVVSPIVNFEPPHYDGIQCLALNKNVLFSASRDTCIKKWLLNSTDDTSQLRSPIQPPTGLMKSINNAHKDWICGLSFLDDRTLISACRSGYMKVWSAEGTCELLGEQKAHNCAINALAVSQNAVTSSSADCRPAVIFSGDSNGSIGFWRCKLAFNRCGTTPCNSSRTATPSASSSRSHVYHHSSGDSSGGDSSTYG